MLLFSGQGSQFKEMSLDVLNNFTYLKEYLDITENIINRKLTPILKNENELEKIENSQISIFFASALVLIVLEKEFDLKIQDFKYVAGHSLGEYTALFAAKAINFEEAINLLKIRSEVMSSTEEKDLGMASVLGEDLEIKITNCINNLSIGNKNNISIANFNSDSQIVISGAKTALEEFKVKATEFDIKKVVSLPVSSAFHSKFMNNAKIKFEENIKEIKIKTPAIPIIMNKDSNPTINPFNVKKNLIENITSQVKWYQSITFAYNNNVKKFTQIGCKEILINMIKRVKNYQNLELKFYNSLENIKEFTK